MPEGFTEVKIPLSRELYDKLDEFGRRPGNEKLEIAGVVVEVLWRYFGLEK